MKTINIAAVDAILSDESDCELTWQIAGQNAVALRQLLLVLSDTVLIYFPRTSAEVCEI